MWRFTIAAVLLAACLAGCSSGKDFEKDILGHPAPESPSDTGWSRTPPPPPPPPPPAPTPNNRAAMPPVTPAAPAPQPVAPPTAAPVSAPAGENMVLTFQVGSFAHVENAKELMRRLEAKGYTTRLDQGRMNNRAYFMLYASKEGSRAALEGDLFASGVTEPVLAEEHPANAPSRPSQAAPPAAPAKAQLPPGAPKSPKVPPKPKTPGAKAPVASKPLPAAKIPPKASPAAKVPSTAPAAATVPPKAKPIPVTKGQTPPQVKPAPPASPPPAARQAKTLPGVEPAPPLPDGYVPPPPKASGS
jgi:hypothetical protein